MTAFIFRRRRTPEFPRRDSVEALRRAPEQLEDRRMLAPVINEIVPVAVYEDTPSAFGAAYDSNRDLIWYGGLGGSTLRSVKPFSSYTAAEIAALPLVDGIRRIDNIAGEHAAFTTTAPSGTFSALGYDAASDRLVTAVGDTLQAFDPITAANQDLAFREGPPDQSPDVAGDIDLIDGLDIDGTNTWYSPDIGPIYKNGALFASPTNDDQRVRVVDGAVSDQTGGWAGVEQIGGRVFAVAPLSNGDRTIVRFDAVTGELLGFDPNGDPIAERFEDLAFDGRFLYAADLRGDIDGDGTVGDIYVFAISGEGGTEGGDPCEDVREGDLLIEMPVEGAQIAVIGLGHGEFKVISVSDGLEIERHSEITGRILVDGDEGPDHVVFTFFPRQAHDVIFCGRGGNDFLMSGAGDDFADGGDGKDILVTLGGDDELLGGPNNDILYAGYGDDRLSGGEDNDKLYAGPGNDIARGGEGADRVVGGFGNDILLGNEGNDTIWGEFGLDICIGGDGADRVIGGANDDIVFGGTTAYDAKSDANDESLKMLLAEWTSSRRTSQRVANLIAGTGNTQGRTLEPGVTVFDDEFVDGLLDEFGGNWFIRGASPRDFAFGALGGRTTWI